MMRGFALAAALLLTGCAGTSAQVATTPAAASTDAAKPPRLAETDRPPSGARWLYGSAESAVAVGQVFRQIASYGGAVARHRPVFSVVLAPGSTPRGPEYVPCGDKPLAAVFDADETLLWNVGAQREFGLAQQDFDKGVWTQWENDGAGQAWAMPGAADMLATLRAAGIRIVVISNRAVDTQAGTIATLKAAGLGDFVPGETLFLQATNTSGSKDARRAIVAENFCVVLMAGDQLGDFAQAFNDPALPVADRKALVGPEVAASQLWGNGWFLIPNAAYGPWDKYDFKSVFPGVSWQPKQGGE